MSVRRLLGRCLLAFGLLLSRPLLAQAPSEYQVKAVFLFNVAQFVEWPPETFADASTPFTIGVLGNDPFGAALTETIRGEHVGARDLKVRNIKRGEEIPDCQILFVSQSERDRVAAVLATRKGRPMLVVSDIDRFATMGGMIGFVMDRSRVRMQVNLQAMQAAHLTVSSKLLRVAEVVESAGR